MTRKRQVVPIPDRDGWCGQCTHARGEHKRGWGPCTSTGCDCRRFAISTYAEVPPNGR